MAVIDPDSEIKGGRKPLAEGARVLCVDGVYDVGPDGLARHTGSGAVGVVTDLTWNIVGGWTYTLLFANGATARVDDFDKIFAGIAYRVLPADEKTGG